MKTTTRMTALETSWAKSAPFKPDDPCLEAHELIEFAEDGKKASVYERACEHVAHCSSCAATLRALKKVPANSALGSLRQVGRDWVEGAMRLPRWFDSLVAAALRTPVPSYRSTVRPTAAGLLDPNPANQALWPVPAVWTTEGHGRKVSVSVAGREWPVAEALPAGSSVTVEVRSEGDAWTLDDTGVFRFRVLDADGQSKALWARRHSHDAPVACSVALFMVGLFVEAEPLLDKWPEDSELDGLKDLIRQTCDMRRRDAGQFYV